MSMYAIQDTTLTALGDAVRNKLNGTSELPAPISKENVGSSNGYMLEVIEFPKFVKTVKVMGRVNDVDMSDASSQAVLHNLAYASGVYIRDREAREASDFTIINPDWNGVGYDYEITVNSNALTFITAHGYNTYGVNFTFSYTAIGLDENGNEFKYTPLEMADVINNLMTIPGEALTITGDCSNRFANRGWDWFINQCGDKITTNNITDTTSMFYRTTLKTIPFDINIASNISTIQNTFTYAEKLEVVPYIIGPEKKPPTSSYSGTLDMSYLFNNCQRLRYIPENYFWKIVPNKDFWETQANLSSAGQSTLFAYCYSLRKLPDISMIGGNWTSSYSCIYYNLLQFCYSLDEATNIPVYGTFSSNAMNNLFYSNYRLKEFMFLMNEDGTPKTANWKNQTIDLSSRDIGFGNYSPTNYNGGITPDKRVIDDATYQALKDDPDWYSYDINYSRYNHDSAVNTINSLPDCSATGTNTIKFKGQAGALTDGGAINTLTEEEIAVASAKGWSVALV